MGKTEEEGGRTCSAKYTVFWHLGQTGVPPPHCRPVPIGVIGEVILPPRAAPYLIPVPVGTSGTEIVRSLVTGVAGPA